jgi:hypothetical protein
VPGREQKLIEGSVPRVFHIVNMSERVNGGGYDRMAVRRLQSTRDFTDDILVIMNRLQNTCLSAEIGKQLVVRIRVPFRDTPFSPSTWRMQDLSEKQGANLGAMLSAEFVASVYESLGVLSAKRTPVYEHTPLDFSPTVCTSCR